MAAFYENQRTLQIRANPADVIEAIKAAGVPSLRESQIKNSKVLFMTYKNEFLFY